MFTISMADIGIMLTFFMAPYLDLFWIPLTTSVPNSTFLPQNKNVSFTYLLQKSTQSRPSLPSGFLTKAWQCHAVHSHITPAWHHWYLRSYTNQWWNNAEKDASSDAKINQKNSWFGTPTRMCFKTSLYRIKAVSECSWRFSRMCIISPHSIDFFFFYVLMVICLCIHIW